MTNLQVDELQVAKCGLDHTHINELLVMANHIAPQQTRSCLITLLVFALSTAAVANEFSAEDIEEAVSKTIKNLEPQADTLEDLSQAERLPRQ